MGVIVAKSSLSVDRASRAFHCVMLLDRLERTERHCRGNTSQPMRLVLLVSSSASTSNVIAAVLQTFLSQWINLDGCESEVFKLVE